MVLVLCFRRGEKLEKVPFLFWFFLFLVLQSCILRICVYVLHLSLISLEIPFCGDGLNHIDAYREINGFGFMFLFDSVENSKVF